MLNLKEVLEHFVKHRREVVTGDGISLEAGQSERACARGARGRAIQYRRDD